MSCFSRFSGEHGLWSVSGATGEEFRKKDVEKDNEVLK